MWTLFCLLWVASALLATAWAWVAVRRGQEPAMSRLGCLFVIGPLNAVIFLFFAWQVSPPANFSAWWLAGISVALAVMLTQLVKAIRRPPVQRPPRPRRPTPARRYEA